MTTNLFRGKLLRLTAPRPEDAEVIQQWYDDPDYLRLMDSDPARPRHANAIYRFFTDVKDDRDFVFHLRTLEDDRLVGFSALWVSWNHQTAGLSIGIGDPDYQNRGYGSEGLALTVGYAFRELNLYRVGLTVFSYNTRAIHVYEKCGFVQEGRVRGFLCRDGQRHDMLYMGILRSEWETRQTPSTE
jgi:RimJ/RimL family protein N-acetyltransferase